MIFKLAGHRKKKAKQLRNLREARIGLADHSRLSLKRVLASLVARGSYVGLCTEMRKGDYGRLAGWPVATLLLSAGESISWFLVGDRRLCWTRVLD